MSADWPELTIDELKSDVKNAIAMGPFGSRIKAENFVKSGVPVIKGGNLNGDFLSEEKFDFLTEEKADELRSSNAFRGDIVITHRGTLGQVGIIPDDSLYQRYVVSQSQLKVSLDKEKVNPYFVYYFLRTQLGQHRLLMNSSQVGVPAIAKASTSVKQILIPCPDKTIQNKIVNVIKSVDEKIKVNYQINQTLEQMAQAIFKSWFVDFDPVKVKREILKSGGSEQEALLAAMQSISGKSQEELITFESEQPKKYKELKKTVELFPSEMQENDIGIIPEGWEVKKASTIIKRLKSGKKYTKKNVETDGHVPVFEQGSTLLLGFHNNRADINASLQEPHFIFGDHTCITHISTVPFSVGPNVIPLKSTEFDAYWTYYAIKDLQPFQEYRRHWMEFAVKDVIVPNDPLITECFGDRIKDFYQKINLNYVESRSLVEIRDTILPKLLSGDCFVSDVSPEVLEVSSE